MGKLNNLMTGAMVVGAVAMGKAQQTLQKVTAGTNQTVVELFQVRNGNNVNNVVGSAGYDQGMSDVSGAAIQYLESTGKVYTQSNATNETPSAYPVEQIGNGNFELATPQPYGTNKATKKFNWKDENGNPLSTSQFSLRQEDTDRDAVEDGNTNIDMLHTKWILPHTFDNGLALPVGLHMILISREGWKQPNGGSHPTKRIGFRWDGGAWVQQAIDPEGNPYDTLQNATLGINDIDVKKNKGVAYPNPTNDTVHLNDGDTASNESFEYVIYDATGRQVGAGKAREDQPISLGKNNNGMYLINAKYTDGDTTSHRVIKK
ncbi:MAG: T9SS type A sorting domain-containing protein [Bergeyella sp.]